jgi:hypothetical protein
MHNIYRRLPEEEQRHLKRVLLRIQNRHSILDIVLMAASMGKPEPRPDRIECENWSDTDIGRLTRIIDEAFDEAFAEESVQQNSEEEA